MAKAGVLIHVYHLETAGWEKLVWGNAAKNLLGTLPKLVQLLLAEGADESITDIIMYTGPSQKAGLTEGEYAKKFLLDHFDELDDFAQLHGLLAQKTEQERKALYDFLEQHIITGKQLVNSAAEVAYAAQHFKERGVTKVYQIAIASHAPRCIQLQAVARHDGKIPAEQLWYTVVADTTYKDTTPSDVIVAEPPHRGDDPAYGVHPGITDVLKRYYNLPYEARRPFIQAIESALQSPPKH